MPYEYKKNANVDESLIIQNPFREIKFDFPYVCDGCAEKCAVSVNLRTEPMTASFTGDVQRMLFRVQPEMYAGDKKLFDFPVNRRNVYYPRGSNMSVLYTLGDSILSLNEVYDRYKSALVWCRKTCKHSKMR
ncbi:MAG: hypothetical protein IKB10_03085 [Alphaproteobacteria bacterium]|nr:hypothetical protein [Alphaproteobacteria bacterium]